MRFRFLIIASLFVAHSVMAQDGTASLTPAQANATISASAATTPSTVQAQEVSVTAASASGQTAIMDYQSVYEAATVEEEVKMATERFSLTPSQQEMWNVAATERRASEAQSRVMLDSKASNYEKEGAYRGLRSTQNTFYETIIGHLTPAQKNSLETDRMILQEKQKRLAKLPPPPPPVPVDTVNAAADSSAVMEAEKDKELNKKSKKKKKK